MITTIATYNKTGKWVYNLKTTLPAWATPILAGAKSIENQDLYAVAKYLPRRLTDRSRNMTTAMLMVFILPAVYRILDGETINLNPKSFCITCSKAGLDLNGEEITDWRTDGQHGHLPTTVDAKYWKDLFIEKFNQWKVIQSLANAKEVEQAIQSQQDWEEGYGDASLK